MKKLRAKLKNIGAVYIIGGVIKMQMDFRIVENT